MTFHRNTHAQRIWIDLYETPRRTSCVKSALRSCAAAAAD